MPTVLADGEPVERAKLPAITIAPGVTATLGWGRGALVERVEMQANATYPAQTLTEELFVIVQDGVRDASTSTARRSRWAGIRRSTCSPAPCAR